jgi:hypothetical protein
VYITPDDAKFFGDIFLYGLLVERDKWLEKSLIDFFQSEWTDYAKWLGKENREAAATNDEGEHRRFRQARQDYRAEFNKGIRCLPHPQ